jgi:hypothetical protein
MRALFSFVVFISLYQQLGYTQSVRSVTDRNASGIYSSGGNVYGTDGFGVKKQG